MSIEVDFAALASQNACQSNIPDYVRSAMRAGTFVPKAFNHWNGELEISRCVEDAQGVVTRIGEDATDEQMRLAIVAGGPYGNMGIDGEPGIIYPCAELSPSWVFVGTADHCRFTFCQAAKDAKSVTLEARYEGFSGYEDGATDLALPMQLVSRFFKAARSAYDYLICIEKIELSDGRAYAIRWADSNDILKGLIWEKVPLL